MKHYVVLCDAAADKAGYDETHVTAVAHDYEEAKRILQEKAKDEKKYAKENGWEIHVDEDNEFDAGEEGFYASEHVHFYIEEVDDEKTDTTIETEKSTTTKASKDDDFPW